MKNQSNHNEIMELFARNPEKGFEQIYKAFAGPIFRYLRNSFRFEKEEAEDILQNVFLPWVKNPEKFARVENLSAYLFTSARNAALKRKSEKRPSGSTESVIAQGHSEKVENGVIIDQALSQLPSEQREAVVLKIWNNMTFAEISQLQNTSLQTIASRYRYAIDKLKELIPWQR